MAATRHSALTFAVLAAFALAGMIASADATSTSALTIVKQPQLRYRPSRCYRRSQICCYSYRRCGQLCRKPVCTVTRVCTKYNWKHRCIRYRVIRVCRTRCYTRYCSISACSPYVVSKSNVYKAPRPTILSKKAFVKKTVTKITIKNKLYKAHK